MTERYYSTTELLTTGHDLGEFDCGSDAQTEWLHKHAIQATLSGSTKVYAVRRLSDELVVGYYALSAGSVSREAAPSRVARGLPSHPVPVVILTRLGVDVSEHGKGLGRALVKDALLRVAAASDIIGVRALLIHAESEVARAFYQGLAGFEQSPTDDLHLFLLLKDLRKSLTS